MSHSMVIKESADLKISQSRSFGLATDQLPIGQGLAWNRLDASTLTSIVADYERDYRKNAADYRVIIVQGM